MAHSTVTLTGTYDLPSGVANAGSVVIWLVGNGGARLPQVVDATGSVIISGELRIPLDDDGHFTVDLPATDDDRLAPTGFGYGLSARLPAKLPTLTFSLPAATPTVDVSKIVGELPPVLVPTTAYATQAALDALDGRVATVEGDVAGLAPVATSGAYADLSGKPSLGTASTHAVSDFATAAQGAKADSAVQPGSLAPVATSGDYSDLDNAPTIPSTPGDVGADPAGAADAVAADLATETSARTAADSVLTTALGGKLAATLKGAANGLAELDGSGLVPTAQLPSYVDDILEFANLAAFPATGETGKIYVAKDTNLTYRWGGSTYGVLDPSLALGETSSTAYRGDRGKTAYDHSQLTSGNPHNVTKADVGLGSVDNTSDLAKPISTATQTALNAKADSSSLGTAATHPATDFATSTQGGKADTAVQPAGLTKTAVGLGNADNTSDANKPISTAQQAALDLKAVKSAATSFTGAQTNTPYAVPAAAQVLCIRGLGPGGPGGSGRLGAAGTARTGGGGGAGGAFAEIWVSVASLGGASPLYVTVGGGGAPGAAVTTNDTDGNPGVLGTPNVTSVCTGTSRTVANTLLYSPGGAVGGGGKSGVAGSGGGVASGRFNSSGGAASSATGAAPTVAGQPVGGAGAGGGAGGGISTSNTPSAGGGGGANVGQSNTPAVGGAINTTGASGINGIGLQMGQGGAGGGASITGAGGAGGSGGLGSGGAGGGASLNGNNSGAGGAGGDGFVEIIAYF